MASVLVVCTGNVCRSPSAEGLLRRAFDARLGAGAVSVTSSGTSGWEGSPATPESIAATSERGADIAGHRARELTAAQIHDADLVLAMAGEHREAVVRIDPTAAPKTYLLTELVRLIDGSASPGIGALVAASAARRTAAPADVDDADIEDPLGMSLDTYRAMARQLDELSRRLAAALQPAAMEAS